MPLVNSDIIEIHFTNGVQQFTHYSIHIHYKNAIDFRFQSNYYYHYYCIAYRM